MKRIILVSMFFLAFTSFMSLNAQWARIFGGDNDDETRYIHQTTDGGYIVAGVTESFGAGGSDIWVLKLSPSGEIEWQKTYGGTEVYCVQQTSDGGYIVAGETSSDIWVLKLFSNGDIEWQKTYGGSDSDYPRSIQQTSDGGYIVAGTTESFGAGGRDAWILKLSSSGEIEWQKTYGGNGSDNAASIQQTSDGGYIAAGYSSSFTETYDFWVLKLSPNGEIEWQKTYGGNIARSIQQTSDGGYILAGWDSSFGAGGYDMWILKLSSNGDVEWQNAYGRDNDDEPYSIQQTTDGGYIVAGYTMKTYPSRTIWVLKLSSSGEIEWQKIGGNENNSLQERARSIQQTTDGGYIVAGYTDSFGLNDYSSFLILKLNSQGEIDPSCDIIVSTDATITPTSFTPADTNIEPQDTNVVPLETSVSPQDTDANVILPCEVPRFILDITHTAGGMTIPGGRREYYSGTIVGIGTYPDSGYVFCGWTGDVPSGQEYDNSISITVDSDKSIRATFEYGTCYGDDEEDEASEKKGSCFIATGVYGSPLHPYVRILRDFRDRYLIPSRCGRILVSFYYKYSPFVANMISKHKVLEVAVRISLLPVIAFSYSMLHFGSAITAVMLVFIFAFPIFFVWFYRRKLSLLEAKDPKALDS